MLTNADKPGAFPQCGPRDLRPTIPYSPAQNCNGKSQKSRFDAVIGNRRNRQQGQSSRNTRHRKLASAHLGLLAGRGAIPKPTEIRSPITAGNSSRSITPLWGHCFAFVPDGSRAPSMRVLIHDWVRKTEVHCCGCRRPTWSRNDAEYKRLVSLSFASGPSLVSSGHAPGRNSLSLFCKPVSTALPRAWGGDPKIVVSDHLALSIPVGRESFL